MPIRHKFAASDFGHGFKTENAILSTTPYPPEILFVGTFNPDTDEKSNPADFYYGRNWFWPAFFNLLEYKKISVLKQRKFHDFVPSQESILNFCEKYHITFADLIDKVLHYDNPEFELFKNIALFKSEEFDLINDDDLSELDEHNQVSWTTKLIIGYIQLNKTINTVYFTRQPTKLFQTHWRDICEHDYGRQILFRTIYTPSGQGLRGRPRMNMLLKSWLYHEDQNRRLDTQWVDLHGPDQNEFFKTHSS